MELLQQVLSVALVLALMGAALWLLGGRGRGAPRRGSAGAPPVETLGSAPLGPRHALHLVRVADRVLVIAVGEAGCTLVDRLNWRPAAGETS